MTHIVIRPFIARHWKQREYRIGGIGDIGDIGVVRFIGSVDDIDGAQPLFN